MSDDHSDAEWERERRWLIEFMRCGMVMTTEAERARTMAALDRWGEEIGEDPERALVHEAGHAVVAHALGWFVEYVDPAMPDNKGGGALTHQRRLEYSRNTTEWQQFQEQVLVGIAGYVAEEMKFGLALPFEAVDLLERAWEEHGLVHNQHPDFIKAAERGVKAILTQRSAAVEKLVEGQRTIGRLQGDALATILSC